MDYIIRKRQQEDCPRIAHVVTVAWNETYQGLVPDWFLSELIKNEDMRATKTFNEFNEDTNTTLVLVIDNEIVGFTNYGKTEDTEFTNCGEIYALYILKDYQGNGYGKKLVEEAIKEIKKLDCDKMVIACLKGNPSNEFYKHIGGTYIKDGIFTKLDLPENIYYYENI